MKPPCVWDIFFVCHNTCAHLIFHGTHLFEYRYTEIGALTDKIIDKIKLLWHGTHHWYCPVFIVTLILKYYSFFQLFSDILFKNQILEVLTSDRCLSGLLKDQHMIVVSKYIGEYLIDRIRIYGNDIVHVLWFLIHLVEAPGVPKICSRSCIGCTCIPKNNLLNNLKFVPCCWCWCCLYIVSSEDYCGPLWNIGSNQYIQVKLG